MTKLTCAIVEDDPVSSVIVRGLAEKTDLLDILNTFSSPGEALPWLIDNEVELLFLDVEMPGMTGLDMVRTLGYKPAIIVISAKPDYAVEAFDLSVADYLVKPVKDYSRFLAAVNKVIAHRKQDGKDKATDETLFVKVDSLLMKLDIDTILWIEAYGDYIKIQTEKTYTVYATLKKMEEKLDPQKFVRVHRSFIVNLTKATSIDTTSIEINKKIIPVSGTYKNGLLDKINVL